ncbi:MMPL family transporter, partial [Methylobacterium crusticola]|uniref:MMPL family transporter n=1 Tax=Methylobacterium crusticola TaxID=1697972 RepID=UPI001EE28A6D
QAEAQGTAEDRGSSPEEDVRDCENIVREEVSRNGLVEGTRRAISRTGGVITSAGIILAGTFSVLASLPLRDLVQLGFAVTLGILLDTFV